MLSVHTTLEEFENEGFTLKTHQMFSVHTTPEIFENEGFTLETHQMFSVHTTLEEFENLRRHRPFWVCVKLRTGTETGKSIGNKNYIAFE